MKAHGGWVAEGMRVIIKNLLFVLLTGLFINAVSADEGSVFLFPNFISPSEFSDVEVRDSQNRIITSAASHRQLQSLFVISLYQALLVRSTAVESLVAEVVRKNLPDFNSIKKSTSRDVVQFRCNVSAIIQKFEKIIISFVFLPTFLVFISKILTANYQQPPVVKQSFEILRC